MPIELKKRIKIEHATSFKLEFYSGGKTLKSREFTSIKLMEQFNSRQKDFMYLAANRYAFIDGKWQRFIKLTSDIVFEQDLNKIIEEFNDVLEEEDIKNYED